MEGLNCHFHPKAKAVGFCSVCGLPLCKKCIIEDGEIYCEDCYATREEAEEAEDDAYIDMELMDLLDTEDDEGLF